MSFNHIVFIPSNSFSSDCGWNKKIINNYLVNLVEDPVQVDEYTQKIQIYVECCLKDQIIISDVHTKIVQECS